MFVDLMSDIHTTFTERFLRAQLVFNAPPPPPPPAPVESGGDGARPRRRYNALGVLEDVPQEVAADSSTAGNNEAQAAAPRQDPTVVGAGRARRMSDFHQGSPQGGKRPGAPAGNVADWANVGRNDPCPCGSGKKYKKCHGA